MVERSDTTGTDARDPASRRDASPTRDDPVDRANSTITGNRSPGGSIPIHLQPSCSEVTQENNAAKAAK